MRSSHLEHDLVVGLELVPGPLARGHLDDDAARGPDVRRPPVALGQVAREHLGRHVRCNRQVA